MLLSGFRAIDGGTPCFVHSEISCKTVYSPGGFCSNVFIFTSPSNPYGRDISQVAWLATGVHGKRTYDKACCACRSLNLQQWSSWSHIFIIIRILNRSSLLSSFISWKTAKKQSLHFSVIGFCVFAVTPFFSFRVSSIYIVLSLFQRKQWFLVYRFTARFPWFSCK